MDLPDILESFTLKCTSRSDSLVTFSGLAADDTGQRVYGGQLMAQALSAAQQTVDPSFVVHSMQSNFYRPCFPDAPVEYTVGVLRTGRSFATRSVLLKQNDKPIFNATFSLQTPEQGFEHAAAMPAAANTHSQMLAYASDNPISSPAFNILGENPFVPGVQSVTLSHALWFHRPVKMDEWVLFELSSDVTCGGRGLCHARVFMQSGELVASAVQEIVIRKRRP